MRVLTLLLTLAFGSAIGQKENPIVMGHSLEIHSKVLDENRTINIYLPEDYNAADSACYPVIYLLDGSTNEDFIHVAGLVQFSTFEWVNYLSKSILVGIGTVDRRRDFSFPTSVEEDKKKYPTSGGSQNFILFLVTELQPLIEKKYNIRDEKTLIGQSMGGLLATEILATMPNLFDSYIIVSPSLWWNNGSLLENEFGSLKNPLESPIKVYVAVGKEGLTPSANSRLMEVDAQLLAEKLKSIDNPLLQVWFDYLPKENHGTILHQAVLNAFKTMP